MVTYGFVGQRGGTMLFVKNRGKYEWMMDYDDGIGTSEDRGVLGDWEK